MFRSSCFVMVSPRNLICFLRSQMSLFSRTAGMPRILIWRCGPVRKSKGFGRSTSLLAGVQHARPLHLGRTKTPPGGANFLNFASFCCEQKSPLLARRAANPPTPSHLLSSGIHQAAGHAKNDWSMKDAFLARPRAALPKIVFSACWYSLYSLGIF
jgi:hypothetical protein